MIFPPTTLSNSLPIWFDVTCHQIFKSGIRGRLRTSQIVCQFCMVMCACPPPHSNDLPNLCACVREKKASTVHSVLAASDCVPTRIGTKFVEPPTFDISKSFADSVSRRAL